MATSLSEQELFRSVRVELFTAVVGDVMDAAGLTRQFLPPQIAPLRDDMVVVGRAMPVLEADCFSTLITHENASRPFGLMFEALDDLKPGEVYICAGASPTYALWGELMSVRARKLGAAGAVVNGYSRDTRGILNLNFPTFSYGRYAQDQGVRGRVIDWRCRIEFQNQVEVYPGDIVFGDLDGVLIIPQQHEKDILQKALEKVRGEKLVRKALDNGLSARDAFDKYGIM